MSFNKLLTVISFFQIANVHPPTVKKISFIKGDLCKVLTLQSCAYKQNSGRAAKRMTKNITALFPSRDGV